VTLEILRASFYHEMLGFWLVRIEGQSRPGYATELEKLKPAESFRVLVARLAPKAGFPTVKDA
jgi:hypothetical protein